MESHADPIVPHGRHLPLDSKWLTTAHLKQVASDLEYPMTGAADQLYQVIEGKIGTDGHKVVNVQKWFC